VKVTVPCAFVTPSTGADKHGVKAAGVRTAVTPSIGLPWLSTILRVAVTFGGHLGTIIDDIVVVTATMEVDTVCVTVAVALNWPPKGAKCSIVARGNPSKAPVLGMGEPTIHPSLGEIMYTEFRNGGNTVTAGAFNPINAGANVICVQPKPSQ
jgi:hypothetical protein